LLKLERRASKFPELVALRPLTLAGQQAMMQGEMGCAADFWQRLREQDFNPQLAVNLMKVLSLMETTRSYSGC